MQITRNDSELHPHYALMRRLWEAIAVADAPVLRRVLSEKTVWRMPGTSPFAGVYVGPDAAFGLMARVGELTDELSSDLLDIFVSDRGAVLHYNLHATRGPQKLDTEHLILIEIERGQVTQLVFAPLDQRAYDAFFTPH